MDYQAGLGDEPVEERRPVLDALEPATHEHPEAIPGPLGFRPGDIAAYRYSPVAVSYGLASRIDPVKMLKAIACYRYQSCEHPGWTTSEAYRFCDALEGWLIRKLPGYEDAPWDIEALEQVATPEPCGKTWPQR